MRYGYALLICGCLIASGCDTERLNKLEKENADLKSKLDRQSAVVNYDLQAKCSKDARAWFNENWSGVKSRAASSISRTTTTLS